MTDSAFGCVEWECVEVCPHCMGENVYPNYDVDTQGYIVHCQHCGKEIFLCDECMHNDDNPDMFCDWHGAKLYGDNIQLVEERGQCMRGTTINYEVK